MSKSNYEAYSAHMKKLADVEYAIGVLSWDKEVNLPSKGAGFRSQQVATLSGIAFEIFTDNAFGDLLSKLQEKPKDLNPQQLKNIQLTQKDLSRTKKFDKAFVIKRSQLVSTAYHKWLEARKTANFSIYQKAIEDLVELKKEEANIIGYEDHPYDALLDEFEPTITTKELDILFKDVKEQLVEFVMKIRSQPQVDDRFLRKHYASKKQWDFGIDVLKNLGYDFDAGRQDISAHPFTINFSPMDVRVTTRVDENNFGSMTWSCIHEGGHALYEQGLPSAEYGLPLGRFVSLGIHESQSRLWENNVGRSLPYWKAHYKKLQSTFPDNLSDISVADFYKGINKIQPSLIRVESDELHYHFHILIRYEIEKALIEGSLEVKDMKAAWNEKYKTYLNLDVPDDNQGILQDIHWAHGSFGYFPTYSIGSFYGAQFFNQAKKDIPDLIQKIEKGDNSALLAWLRNNIHQHGRFFSAKELCERVTGEPLNFKYFMDYAREKFEQIYNL